MDCMDCHNRPTHIYEPPDAAVDKAMASFLISRTLPWVKKTVVDALVVEYPNRGAAHEGLRSTIATFYRDRYPVITSYSIHYTKLYDAPPSGEVRCDRYGRGSRG